MGLPCLKENDPASRLRTRNLSMPRSRPPRQRSDSLIEDNPKCPKENVVPKKKEIRVCRDNATQGKGVKTRLPCFRLMRRREKSIFEGGQLSETETSKRGNMSEVVRRNLSNKTSEIRRTFVFRTSTPVGPR